MTPDRTGVGDVVGPGAAHLTPAQRAVLVARLRARSQPGATAPLRLPRVPREGVVRASASQQQLWLLEQLDPGGGAYNVVDAIRIRGELDPNALAAAITQLVERHEVLRTVYAEISGELVQRITDHPDVPLAITDFCLVPDAADRELRLTERIRDYTRQPFDLGCGPVLRVELVRLGPADHAFITAVHHIACDGWSVGVMAHELSTLYAAALTGREAGLPPAPQFADYAAWQRDRTVGTDTDLAYWRKQLAGAPSSCTLPADLPRPVRPGSAGAKYVTHYPADVADALSAIGVTRRATPFMVLLAAAWVLIHRYTAQSVVTVGTPLANRSGRELFGIVGPLLNTLPMTVRIDPECSFSDIVERARETVLGATAHAGVPFEQIVRDIGAGSDRSHAPFFEVLFAVRAAVEQPQWQGAVADRIEVGDRAAKYDMSIEVERGSHGLTARFVYRTELYRATSVELLADRLGALLARLAAAPQEPLFRLVAADPDERSQLLTGWNATAEPLAAPVEEQFQRQADATPDAVAVAAGGLRWTYRELADRVDELAGRLIAAGARPEAPVLLFAERRPELVAALLAVLRAGGYYIPVDPGTPDGRLRAVCSPGIISVVDRSTRDRLPAGAGPLVDLDAPTAGVPGPRSGTAHGDQLAYVLYTSGSTGVPKGVAITRAGLANYVRWAALYYGYRPGGTSLLHTSLGFDLTVTSLLPPLAAGGAIRLMPPAALADELAAELRRDGCDVLKATPAHLQQLRLLGLPAAARDRIRCLVAGGEALRWPDTQWWAEGTQVVNEYGPTEAVVGCCAYTVSERIGSTVPIGRPIANTRLYVLTRELEPAAVGAIGELYIAGAGVARGYLNDPRQTADRFVPDAFSSRPGGRLYRTGDLARYRHDGVLEFLGRLDDQLTVQGFRIEPAEVENALLAHPAVRQAVVVATPDQADGTTSRLTGYVVGAGCDPDVLRAHLGNVLPRYMVPSAIVVLGTLPLTPNGKVNRSSLPVPGSLTGSANQIGTQREQLMCDLFAEVLGIDHVGVDDSFFQAGGHSLQATRLVSKIRTVFGVDLPMAAVFNAPTVGELVRWLPRGSSAGPELRPAERPAQLPLSYAQQRLWFLEQLAGPGGLYHVPMTIRLSGLLDTEALRLALIDVVIRHESLRTTFPEVYGRPVQRIIDPARADIPLPVTRIDGAELPSLLRAAATGPFDLASELPLRARLYALDHDEHVLQLVLHHIASDGWSMAPLARDLSTAYTARLAGTEPGWEPLPVQYADYTLWQRAVLGDDTTSDSAMARQIEYWRGTLGGLPEVLPLPGDRPRPGIASRRGGRFRVTVNAATHGALRDVARQSAATMFMVLHAAVAALLWRLGCGTELPVGAPVAGRTHEALDDVVGFFVNTLVLRTDVSGQPTFRELIHRVRETDLAAYAHADVPFEYLVEILNPTRSMAHHPLFQVMVSVGNGDQPRPELAGLTVTLDDTETGTAKFDLLFDFTEKFTAEGAPAGIDAVLEYSTDLFDPATAELLVGRLCQLLAAAAQPDTPLSDVDIGTDGERTRLLPAIGSPPAVPSLAEAFRTAAALQPDALAVVCAEGAVTFAELDRRSDRLAHRLRAVVEHAGPAVAAVTLPRSAASAVAVIAVMKAGLTAVVVDATMAADGRDAILADAAPAARIILPDTAGDGPGIPVEADEPAGEPIVECELPEAGRSSPAVLAYRVEPADGVTGVVICAGALAARVAQHARNLEDACGPGRHRVAVGADAGTLGWWFGIAALVAGHELHLLADHVRASAAATVQYAAEHDVRVVDATPRRARELAATGPLGGLRVRVGGEPVHATVRQAFGTAAWFCHDTDVSGPLAADVGTPAAGLPSASGSAPGARAGVLDVRGGLALFGVTGQLYLAGPGLADGYWNRPELTAAQFVPDPFGRPGSRMLRTMQAARWSSNGILQWRGRYAGQPADGSQLDPVAVEAALAGVPEVADAAVAVRPGPYGRWYLAAYVVPAPGNDLDTTTLDTRLAAALPGFTRPAAWSVLDALPTRLDGSLDVTALPEPVTASGPEDARPRREPRTPAEARVCELFREALDVPEVGVDDDFFEAGGYSLIIPALMDRLADEFGVDIGVQELFDAPSAAAMAELIGTLARQPRHERNGYGGG